MITVADEDAFLAEALAHKPWYVAAYSLLFKFDNLLVSLANLSSPAGAAAVDPAPPRLGPAAATTPGSIPGRVGAARNGSVVRGTGVGFPQAQLSDPGLAGGLPGEGAPARDRGFKGVPPRIGSVR